MTDHEIKSDMPHTNGSYELKAAMDDFLTAFESFKDANDERLDQIEKRMSADAVTAEKVERLNAALDRQKGLIDRLSLEGKRPPLDIRREDDAPPKEHRNAFDAYMRKGETAPLNRLDLKALSAGADPDGGYLAPRETEQVVERVVSEASPIRAIAQVRQIGGTGLRKPVSQGGVGTGWVGESEARPETSAANLSVLDFPAMELYAMPAATQSLLDDAYVDLEQWLAGEIQTVFAEQEGAAFVTGDGVAKPRGFLSYDRVADASYSWGKIGTVATGSDGAFPTEDPGDVLIDLEHSLKQAYRPGARFLMNRKTQAIVRKLKDGDGTYLWQPNYAADRPATLLGYPVSEVEDMPDIDTGSPSIAFGNFQRGYLIVDRVGLRILRDPFSAKPFVLFYTTKRVGGGVQNFEAIKLLTFSA